MDCSVNNSAVMPRHAASRADEGKRYKYVVLAGRFGFISYT